MNKLYLNGSIALYGFLICSGWLSHPLLRPWQTVLLAAAGPTPAMRGYSLPCWTS